MRNRQPEGNGDKELGRMNPEKAYAFIDAIRVAFDVGALGLGASGDISRTSSLTTAITVEGFCSFLSMIVAVHEIVNVCGEHCLRRDGLAVESSNYPATQYSTYLFFRMASVLASMAGMTLMAIDLSAGTTTSKTTIGLMLVSVGIFASRAMSGSKHKPSGTVVHVIDEEALLPDDHPPEPLVGQAIQPVPMMQVVVGQPVPQEAGQEMEPVVSVQGMAPVAEQPVSRAARAPRTPAPERPNHFFQAEKAAQGGIKHSSKRGLHKKYVPHAASPKNL